MTSNPNLPEDFDQWKTVAVELMSEAGALIRKAIKTKKSVETKASYADLVTETDRTVEKLLIDGIKKNFPDHRFIGEESTAATGTKCELTDDPTWIIDPVDGTMNFVHGLPFVAISVGLAYKKEIIFGAVSGPVLDDFWCATKGVGAFDKNKKQLKVSSVTDMDKALIAVETGSNRCPEVMEQVVTNYAALAPKVHGIRSLGSAALNMCAVASGMLDCYFEYTLHCWDMAAGKLIIEEAGGVVLDPEGGPLDLMSRRVICGSTKELIDSVRGHLKHIRVPSD